MDEKEKIIAQIIRARKEELPVYIVNDKENAECLRDLEFAPVILMDEVKDYLLELPGTKVILIYKFSPEGKEQAKKVENLVKEYAYAVASFAPCKKENGDVKMYLEEGNTRAELERWFFEMEYTYAGFLEIDRTEKPVRIIKVIPDRLADVIARTLPHIIVRDEADSSEHLYLYQHGVYERATALMMKKIIKKYVPMGYATDYLLRNVYELIMCDESGTIIPFSSLNSNEDIINLRNGLLDINTGELLPHSPEVYSDWQLDFDYEPDDFVAPVFFGFVEDLCSTKEGVVDEEIKARIQEYGGLLLSNIAVSRTKKCLLLVSPVGNTGKSQLLKLWSNMLGAGRTANITLQSMHEKNRFALSQIVGTRAIICGDQTSAVVQDSSIFKMATGGDMLKIERKNKTPYDYTYRGGMVIACNEAPVFKDDKGSHVFSRLCVIPCEHVVAEQDMDSYICDKMLEEKSAIFNWFMLGLQRLMSNNFQFTKSSRAEEFMLEYREKQDTIFRFLQEKEFAITDNPYDVVKKSAFNSAYQNWLKENNIDGVAEKNIKYRMEKHGVGNKKTTFKGQGGIWCYTYIKDTTGFLEE